MAGRPHFYACHLTLDDQPQLRDLVAGYQQALTGMTGIDLIPPQWLHLTMQGIGFTDEISAAELVALDHALPAELGTIDQLAHLRAPWSRVVRLPASGQTTRSSGINRSARALGFR